MFGCVSFPLSFEWSGLHMPDSGEKTCVVMCSVSFWCVQICFYVLVSMFVFCVAIHEMVLLLRGSVVVTLFPCWYVYAFHCHFV